jgi:hypothetical protein
MAVTFVYTVIRVAMVMMLSDFLLYGIMTVQLYVSVKLFHDNPVKEFLAL